MGACNANQVAAKNLQNQSMELERPERTSPAQRLNNSINGLTPQREQRNGHSQFRHQNNRNLRNTHALKQRPVDQQEDQFDEELMKRAIEESEMYHRHETNLRARGMPIVHRQAQPQQDELYEEDDPQFQALLKLVMEESKKSYQADVKNLGASSNQVNEAIDDALVARLENAEQVMEVQEEIDKEYREEVMHGNAEPNKSVDNSFQISIAQNSEFTVPSTRTNVMAKGKSSGLIVASRGGDLVPHMIPSASRSSFDDEERNKLLKQNEELKERIEREKEEERKRLEQKMQEERKRLKEENKREWMKLEKEREEAEEMKRKIIELQNQLKERDQTNQERDLARKEAMVLLNQVNELKKENQKKKHLEALEEQKQREMQAKMKELEDNLQFVNKDRSHIIKILAKICGRISVMCRVRRFIDHDRSASNCEAYLYVKQSYIQVEEEKYPFDYCFDMQATQEEVFERTKYLVSGALEGNNVCILAYGQTGSGKTFTMEGTDEHPGITRNFLAHMYEDLKVKANTLKTTFTTKCQLLELYCDQINCLLSDRKNLKYITSADYVQDAEERTVTDLQGALDLYNTYVKKRRVSSHSWNKESSRSHLIFIVTLMKGGETQYSRMTFVDLAGSERLKKTGVTGKARDESIKINQSLSALTNVLKQLKNNQAPSFRDNKLTLLLQQSMGGKSQTLMFVNVSPKIEDLEETESTLRTGKNARVVIKKA